MSTSSNYIFISQNAAGARDAHKDLEAYLGGGAGLVVVPYFEIPQYRERFDDTEGRFPQLKEVERYLHESEDIGCELWFAQVLPKEEGGPIGYLAVEPTARPLRLFREFPTVSMRYIGILPS